MFKPLNDTVIVLPEPVVKYRDYIKTTLYIPERFEYGPIDPPVWGRVIGIGKECNGDVKKGDRVLWGKFAGAKFLYKEKEYVAVREHDLLAVDR